MGPQGRIQRCPSSRGLPGLAVHHSAVHHPPEIDEGTQELHPGGCRGASKRKMDPIRRRVVGRWGLHPVGGGGHCSRRLRDCARRRGGRRRLAGGFESCYGAESAQAIEQRQYDNPQPADAALWWKRGAGPCNGAGNRDWSGNRIGTVDQNRQVPGSRKRLRRERGNHDDGRRREHEIDGNGNPVLNRNAVQCSAVQSSAIHPMSCHAMSSTRCIPKRGTGFELERSVNVRYNHLECFTSRL
mmetsp:Transcript_29184/g.68575  ORF Transcript_29184/g.68575 Transcript_29184/m.68575 type:complete len:242 (+) Transcript_29184:102-827(+)